MAFEAAEAASRRVLNHDALYKIWYYVYKWLITGFCIKYNFRIRELIKPKSALDRC